MLVKINFDDTYEIISVSTDLTEATFNSLDKEGNPVLLKVKAEPLDYVFLPNVYNLCFGPATTDGGIDDKAQISHRDLSKLFSTIIFFCLSFLQENSRITIGLDGSNDARACLYHRIFRSNKAYLEEYFVALGVDWFVRLLRNGDYERDNDGNVFFKPRPESFDYQRQPSDLYRYYMFHKKLSIP